MNAIRLGLDTALVIGDMREAPYRSAARREDARPDEEGAVLALRQQGNFGT